MGWTGCSQSWRVTTTFPNRGRVIPMVKGHPDSFCTTARISLLSQRRAVSCTSICAVRGTSEGPGEGPDTNHLHSLLGFIEHLLFALYTFGRLKNCVFKKILRMNYLTNNNKECIKNLMDLVLDIGDGVNILKTTALYTFKRVNSLVYELHFHLKIKWRT